MSTIKILLVSSDFHQINNTIANAFREHGHEVIISKWPGISGTFRFMLYSKIYALTDNETKQSEIISGIFTNVTLKHNQKLLDEVYTLQPDVVFILKGNFVLPETIKKLRNNKKVILVLWSYDSALRFSNLLKGGKYYHLFYSFEPTDIPKLYKYGIKAKYLPMAYDSNYYYKLEDKTSFMDVSFVGALSNEYSTRKRILQAIQSNYRHLKLEIWGKTWTWYNPFHLYEYKIKKRLFCKHIYNYNIFPMQVNEIYNSTKICLNIHHSQSVEGLNPRTFEILGAGGFQLVDYKKKIEEFFNIGHEIVCYKNETDLLNKIKYYLENDDERRKIAQSGYDVVRKQHTYKHRAETILNDIEEIKL